MQRRLGSASPAHILLGNLGNSSTPEIAKLMLIWPLPRGVVGASYKRRLPIEPPLPGRPEQDNADAPGQLTSKTSKRSDFAISKLEANAAVRHRRAVAVGIWRG